MNRVVRGGEQIIPAVAAHLRRRLRRRESRVDHLSEQASAAGVLVQPEPLTQLPILDRVLLAARRCLLGHHFRKPVDARVAAYRHSAIAPQRPPPYALRHIANPGTPISSLSIRLISY